MPSNQSNPEHELVQLAKAVISPADLNPGGLMRPQASEKLISMIAKDAFLKQVHLRRMSRLSADIGVADMATRQLVRVPEGSLPTDAQRKGVSEHGAKLVALAMQLFTSVGIGWLRDNADNPQLTQDLEKMFSEALSRDIVDLAFNGTADTGTGFLSLNKGWVQIAKDSIAASTGVQEALFARDATTNALTGTWVERLSSLTKLLPAQYLATTNLIMHTADANAYGEELGLHVVGSPLLADNPLRRFQGIQIQVSPHCPKETVLCTPVKNLVYGLHTRIERNKAYDQDMRAVKYTFDMACDFEIAVKSALVLGH